MSCHKVRRILRYHVPNKPLSPKKFPHHVLYFFSIQRWKRIAIRFSTILSKIFAGARSSAMS